MSRFVQIHSLSSYPAVLLNRDDAGLAKRLPYGGASRLRVSSQCLKRHWRVAEDAWSLRAIGEPMAERSRMAVERAVMPALGELAPDLAEAIRVSLVRSLYGKDAAKVGGRPAEEARNRQALLLGRVELDYLTRLAREAAATGEAKAAEKLLADRFSRGEGKANLKALTEGARLAAGLEGALFGRMVTSDPEANTEAAIHVAHAFTVHAEESESDYFTVVDDLAKEAGETGSAGLFETELTSGLFYGYVVVDGPGLLDNLGGDAALTAKVVEHLVHLIATVSPGAKRGSTAPYAYADLLLAEAGDRQPRSLAGAFRRPVSLKDGGEDVLDRSVARLREHIGQLDACYGCGERRAALCTAPGGLAGVEAMNLDRLAAWAGASLGAAG
jgi:CRISPR system Cascade subunit CasC